MTTVREPRLTPVAILNLRPTQFTVGMREVKAKRKRWRDERTKKGEEFLGKHMIPVILGPKDRHYVIDHHHLARALHDEGVKDVAVTVIKNLSTLDRDSFWFVIVDELIYRLRQVVERSTTAFHKRMRPIVFLQILYARCLGNRLAAPVNVPFGSLTDIAVMPVLWAKDYWDHMFAEKFFTFLCSFITPTLAFGFDLAHPDGELRWT